MPNTFQFSQLERTSGRYVTTALAGSVVVDVGRHGFKPGTDTLIVREGFADTLEMALVPHVLCVEEVVKRGKP